MLDVDVELPRLVADVASVPADEWQPHTEASVDQSISKLTDVGAAVLSLRAAHGDPRRTDPGLPGEPYSATPILSHLSAFAELLDDLPCTLMSARLFRLAPGGTVKPHRDPFIGMEYGKVRLHVPVQTEPSVLMRFGEHAEHWEAGYLWYGPFGGVHEVDHSGTGDRVHLIVDCHVTRGLLDRFPPALVPATVMVNRPTVEAAPVSFAPGRHVLHVARRALDWTESTDASLDEPMAVTLDVTGDLLHLTMPSGVVAHLRPLGGGDFGLGLVPEETLIRVDGRSDGDLHVSIVRSVGDDSATYPCRLVPAGCP